jgi:crossover junction endodeoxyribonuclease RuvC
MLAVMAPPLRIIGIDPGVSGALAALDVSSGALTVLDMPTLAAGPKGRRAVDALGVVRALETLAAPRLLDGVEVVAVLEQVGVAPGEGPVGAFAFGRGVGVLEAALAALRIPAALAPPAVWKRALRVPAAKDGAIAHASRLYPQHAHLFRGPRGGGLDGRAEALLLAVYGARSVYGNLLTLPQRAA